MVLNEHSVPADDASHSVAARTASAAPKREVIYRHTIAVRLTDASQLAWFGGGGA